MPILAERNSPTTSSVDLDPTLSYPISNSDHRPESNADREKNRHFEDLRVPDEEAWWHQGGYRQKEQQVSPKAPWRVLLARFSGWEMLRGRWFGVVPDFLFRPPTVDPCPHLMPEQPYAWQETEYPIQTQVPGLQLQTGPTPRLSFLWTVGGTVLCAWQSLPGLHPRTGLP